MTVHALTLVACGGASERADERDAQQCGPVPVAEYCAGTDGCPASLDDAVDTVRKTICLDPQLKSYQTVLRRGCGLTNIDVVGTISLELLGLYVGDVWFDSGTGELVGLRRPDYAGGCDVEAGVERPSSCEDDDMDSCGLCGWNICEYQQCQTEIAACAFDRACSDLWECSHRTGCQAEACASESSCPRLTVEAMPKALEPLESMMTCLEASGCDQECPLSLRVYL